MICLIEGAFGGICCFSSVLLITTDTECETVCCQTLVSINIIPAHWAGIQPISGPKLGEMFYKTFILKEPHNLRTVQVIISVLQQICCQTMNLRLCSVYCVFERLLISKDSALKFV